LTVFVRQGTGYAARLDAVESELLHEVLTELVSLLTDDRDRADPLVARLFPDVYPDDPAASDDLRRYTDDDLAAAKREQTATMLSALPRGGGVVRLDDEGAEAWLRTLTDARLALGLRLDIRDDVDLETELDEAVAKDPTSGRVQLLSVYWYLSDLQTSLLEVLAGSDTWDPGAPGESTA
jgi:hypothetical protein